MPSGLVSFRAASIEAALRARGGESLGTTAKRDLERYYALLERALREMRGRFSAEELYLILDAVNGTLWDSTSIPHLAAEIDDAIHLDGLDQKWGVDGVQLLGKLAQLSTHQLWALVDAAERWWLLADPEREMSPAGLARVGLVV